MDEFGSPLAGGIRAVRRNISSSFFGAPRQAQADPVTTDLLQQQSLSLTSISQQLQTVSGQISRFDASLQGVKENLAISDQLERQREAARQNRERILAEQGLREGKESALENKIQTALTQPLQRVGVKTQGVLGRLQNFFLILAGGWLTTTGIDLLQSLSEGNVDKINELKTKFLGGLAIIAGTLTAMTLGIKNSFRILGLFVNNVARVAFGGLLKGSLNGVRLLLAGLVRGAAKLPTGIFGGGGIGSFIRSIVENVIAFRILGAGGAGKKNAVKNASKTILNRNAKKTNVNNVRNANKSGIFKKTSQTIQNQVVSPISKQYSKAKDFVLGKKVTGQIPFNTVRKFGGVDPTMAGTPINPTVSLGRQGGVVGRAKGIVKNLFKKLPGKNMLGKLLGAVGIKGGLGTVLKRFGGPIGSFIFALAMGEGIGSALLGTAGFAAGAAIGQVLIPIPILGGLIGGLLGEMFLRKMFSFAKNFLGKLFGKKDKDKNVEVVSDDMKISKSEKTYTKAEIEALNAGASMDAAGNVIPINKNENKVSQISDVPDDKPEIITLPMGGATGGVQGGGAPTEKVSNTIPLIKFDTTNPHTLYATSVTGAGN